MEARIIKYADEIEIKILTDGYSVCCNGKYYLSNHLHKVMAFIEGERKSKAYKKLNDLFNNMQRRCNNPKANHYIYYGGRGIKICDEWGKRSVFIIWALENGWKDGLEIDRIDVNGNYCPENCRFVTRKENSRNQRSNIPITHSGITYPAFSAFLEAVKPGYTKLDYFILHSRIVKLKWSVESALEAPTNNGRGGDRRSTNFKYLHNNRKTN